MEWEFRPDQVVRDEVEYGLEQFRADLLQEVRMNTGEMDEAQQLRVFAVIYDLCYWAATGNEYDEFLATQGDDSFLSGFLASIRDQIQPSIEMLGAILQRLIMDHVDLQGMPLEQALKEVDVLHRQIVARPSVG